MARSVERELGERVAKLREAAGMTQANLAEEVGVATETISRLERGATIPSVARLDEVAEALGVEMADLFERTPGALARNEALAELLTELRRRSPEEIALVRDLARTVFAFAAKRRSTGGASKKNPRKKSSRSRSS